MQALDNIITSARAAPRRIVLCEGEDPRILEAAARCAADGLALIELVGDRATIVPGAKQAGIRLDGIEIVDPATSSLTPRLADLLFERRQAKGITRAQAAHAVQDPLCFADLMVAAKHADGCVAGAIHTTGDVVRNAIQILGLKPGIQTVSSFFLMMFCEPHHQLPRGGLIFSDCGLMIDPNADQLTDIALAAADSARELLDEVPQLAMLSFSTAGSARHPHVDKVVQAAQQTRTRRPELAIDEDIQLDAAIKPDIAARKLPHSRVRGHANVLIFPDLEAGNIGYKIAERMGKARAIGPLLQGLARPANDLSRGCNAEDIYHVIAATVAQAQATDTRTATAS